LTSCFKKTIVSRNRPIESPKVNGSVADYCEAIVFKHFSLLVNADNVLFRQAEQARRLPNIFLATAMHLVFIAVGLGATLAVLFVYFGNWGSAQKALQGRSGFMAAFAGMVVALWIWVRLFEKRPLQSVGLIRKKVLTKYLLGFGFGALMLVIVVGFMYLTGHVTIVSRGTNPVGGATAVGTVLLMLLAWMIQGGSEEIITRGWYQGVIGARYRPWAGVAVSSLLFAVLHLTANPVALLNLLLFGLFLALYCLREGSIWGVCGWHTAWNWTQVKLFGLSVSGHDVPGGALLDLSTKGNRYLSGGDFGPEGSLYSTLVFVIGIAIVITTAKATGE
jgi:membrane protease YdiL (CAAX protease family)